MAHLKCHVVDNYWYMLIFSLSLSLSIEKQVKNLSSEKSYKIKY